MICTLTDFTRVIDGWIADYDMSNYLLPYDQFLDQVSTDLLQLAKQKGFRWGDNMPEFSESELVDVMIEYSVFQ